MKIISLLTVVLFLFACQEEPTENTTDSPDDYSIVSGDTIIYFRQPQLDFFELPVCDGSYVCQPADCIDIDCEAGKLFATSCSATPYPLKCTSENGTSTIVILISGVEYPGKKVCSGNGEFSDPVYHADTDNIPSGSKFDTPPQGWPSARSQGLAIDYNTGKIDIDKSVANGIFGPNPKNGAKHEFRIYYRLNDKSHYTLNYTNITFVYESSSESARVLRPGDTTTVVVKSC